MGIGELENKLLKAYLASTIVEYKYDTFYSHKHIIAYIFLSEEALQLSKMEWENNVTKSIAHSSVAVCLNDVIGP